MKPCLHCWRAFHSISSSLRYLSKSAHFLFERSIRYISGFLSIYPTYIFSFCIVDLGNFFFKFEHSVHVQHRGFFMCVQVLCSPITHSRTLHAILFSFFSVSLWYVARTPMRYMKGDMCVYSHLFSFFFWCCCTSTRVSLKNFHVDITSCCWNYCFFLYYCLKKKDTTQTLAFSGRRVLRKKIKKSKTPNATKRKGAADRTWRENDIFETFVCFIRAPSPYYI